MHPKHAPVGVRFVWKRKNDKVRSYGHTRRFEGKFKHSCYFHEEVTTDYY